MFNKKKIKRVKTVSRKFNEKIIFHDTLVLYSSYETKGQFLLCLLKLNFWITVFRERKNSESIPIFFSSFFLYNLTKKRYLQGPEIRSNCYVKSEKIQNIMHTHIIIILMYISYLIFTVFKYYNFNNNFIYMHLF